MSAAFWLEHNFASQFKDESGFRSLHKLAQNSCSDLMEDQTATEFLHAPEVRGQLGETHFTRMFELDAFMLVQRPKISCLRSLFQIHKLLTCRCRSRQSLDLDLAALPPVGSNFATPFESSDPDLSAEFNFSCPRISCSSICFDQRSLLQCHLDGTRSHFSRKKKFFLRKAPKPFEPKLLKRVFHMSTVKTAFLFLLTHTTTFWSFFVTLTTHLCLLAVICRIIRLKRASLLSFRME